MKRTVSLNRRLVLASLVVLPLFLGLAGYLLQMAYASSQRASIEAQLKTRLFGLLGAAEWQDHTLSLPERLADPDFNQTASGVYGGVRRGDDWVWKSPSAQLLPAATLMTDALPFAAGEHRFVVGKLLSYRLDVVWESADGDEPLTFMVWQTDDELRRALAVYRSHLMITLGVLGLFLLLAQILVLRVGLRPLRYMSRELAKLESGEVQQLDGEYPRELARLAGNLNRVLESHHQQQQRYRNALGDLAHSLKTPLAVLRAGMYHTGDDVAWRALVEPQVARMEQIVGHQLNRAVLVSQAAGRPLVALSPVIERLLAALAKVYRDKTIAVNQQIPTDTMLNADEADLLELFGNVLENAFKYAHRQVAVLVENRNGLSIIIDDDGAGVPEAQRDIVLRRGERADTAVPGQGLGLSIVTDILASYGGELAIDASPWGGARFRIHFPDRREP